MNYIIYFTVDFFLKKFRRTYDELNFIDDNRLQVRRKGKIYEFNAPFNLLKVYFPPMLLAFTYKNTLYPLPHEAVFDPDIIEKYNTLSLEDCKRFALESSNVKSLMNKISLYQGMDDFSSNVMKLLTNLEIKNEVVDNGK